MQCSKYMYCNELTKKEQMVYAMVFSISLFLLELISHQNYIGIQLHYDKDDYIDHTTQIPFLGLITMQCIYLFTQYLNEVPHKFGTPQV